MKSIVNSSHYYFYCYDPRPITASIVVAAMVKQWCRKRVHKTKQVLVYANLNLLTQMDMHKQK